LFFKKQKEKHIAAAIQQQTAGVESNVVIPTPETSQDVPYYEVIKKL
jgi:hypothetical protein